jgi:hypothetical protein
MSIVCICFELHVALRWSVCLKLNPKDDDGGQKGNRQNGTILTTLVTDTLN